MVVGGTAASAACPRLSQQTATKVRLRRLPNRAENAVARFCIQVHVCNGGFMKRFFVTLGLIAAVGCALSAQQQKTPPPLAPASYSPSYGFGMATSPVGVFPSAIRHGVERKNSLRISIEYP